MRDENGDFICDLCGESITEKINIFSFSDFPVAMHPEPDESIIHYIDLRVDFCEKCVLKCVKTHARPDRVERKIDFWVSQ